MFRSREFGRMKWRTDRAGKAGRTGEVGESFRAACGLRRQIREDAPRTIVLDHLAAGILRLLIPPPAIAAEDERVTGVAVFCIRGRDGRGIVGSWSRFHHNVRSPLCEEQYQKGTGQQGPPPFLRCWLRAQHNDPNILNGEAVSNTCDGIKRRLSETARRKDLL